MKSSALLRSSVTLGLWLLLVMAAHAGTVNTVFVPEPNVTTTADDDQLVQVPLHWYSGANIEFYYLANLDGTILPPVDPPVPHITDPGDIRLALGRALERWNTATYGSARQYRIGDIVDVALAPQNPFVPPYSGLPVKPDGVTIDGYNIVDLLNTSVNAPVLDTNEVARTFITYFEKDYPMTEIWSQAEGVPQEFLGVVESNQAVNTTGISSYAGFLINVNPADLASNLVLFIPMRDYKKGEIFDVDIQFNASMVQGFRAWPATIAGVPLAWRADITRTLDIDMVMTHQLGWAFGLGNSMIFDSVMYPYYNLYQSGGGTQYTFLTDPFRKRKLTFDDQMTAGVAWGATFPASQGAIAGQILDGAVVGASTPTNTGGTTTNVTNPTALSAANPFLVQVPVFVGIKPEQLVSVPGLNSGNIDDPTQKHPDIAVSQPATPDPNGGNWRMVAQVMTGQELAVPATQGALLNTLGFTDATNTGIPDVGDQGLQTDVGVFTPLSRINSNYTVPGLPPKDTLGQPVKYAVWLPATFDGLDDTANVAPAFQVTRLGTGFSVNDFFVTPFQFQWQSVIGTATTSYPSEFYGGVDTPYTFGDGSAPIIYNPSDDRFMNNYVAAQMDPDGRIAAAINGGPAFLSGFGLGPRSFVVVSTGGYSFTNQLGPIGGSVDPVIVKDQQLTGIQATIGTSAAGASGSWQQLNKFKIRTEMKPTAAGGLAGLPAGIEVIHTITNLSASATSFTLRQVLDANVFGRENPVYMINGKMVPKSISFQGNQIPREIMFQSWATTTTAIRAFVDVTGGNNTTPSWVTIGTLAELGKILPSAGGVNLRDLKGINLDSGIALGWKFKIGAEQEQIIRYIVGFYPGGKLIDAWTPWTETLAVDTLRNAGEDDPNKIEPVTVAAGKVTDGIDIITNTGPDSTTVGTPPVPEGSATGLLQFIRLASGFPTYDQYLTMGGALGDLDNDGDLDVVTCAQTYGGTGGQNRIYFNEQQINADGSVTRYFRDVTYGDNANDVNAARLLPLNTGNNTVDVVLADFDDDGWQEILFINRGSRHRYYDNLGEDNPGYFVEDTNALPGMLNGPWESAFDIAFRATAGDIDSDGDIDIIISQAQPYYMPDLNAWLDSRTIGTPPRVDYRMHNSQDDWATILFYTERVLVNYKYTPKWAGKFNLDKRKVLSDQIGTYFIDESWGSDDRPGTLTSLVTGRHTPIYQYQYVKSWDPTELDRMAPVFPRTIKVSDTGVASRSYTSPMSTMAIEPHLGPLFGGSALDLMSVRVLNDTNLYGSVTVPRASSPNPPITDYDSFITVGILSSSENTGAEYGADSGFFRNLDLFSNSLSTGTPIEVVGDGIPDGYFGCMNFNMDYGLNSQDMASASGAGSIDQIATDGALFVYEADNDSSAALSLFRYDAYPLFIGMPQGNAHDIDLDGNPNEYDIVPPKGSESFTGLIGDWQNANRPLPLLVPDTRGTASATPTPVPAGAQPYIYIPSSDSRGQFSGYGVQRGENAGTTGFLICGWATQYFDSATFPYANSYADATEWESLSFDRQAVGQPYGAASGDFDRDGDEDVFIVNSSSNGMGFNLTYYSNAPPAPKQLFLNDSFGVFTERLNALLPNTPVNGMGCASGDLDNDGDIDLVTFNAFGPNEAYINQAFTAPPNPLDEKDSTLFYESTYNTIPNVATDSFSAIDYNFSEFSGVTVGAAVADLNMDGRPDLLIADGGKMTTNGDFARVLLNGGKPEGEGVPVFKPGGAAYPGPRTDMWVHTMIPSQGNYYPDFMLPEVKRWSEMQRPSDQFFTTFPEGYLGGPMPGFINDVLPGDVDGDGDPDLLIVRSGEGTGITQGPQVVINSDSNDQVMNNFPDKDGLGDAIFNPGQDIKLTDPGIAPTPGQPILKNQGQKAKFADFNNDGLPDIVIANGLPQDSAGRGAPNVILMNSQALPGKYTDTTEVALPTAVDQGVTHGLYDNTIDVAVADFDLDGNIDILFANDVAANAPLGFRLLLGDGGGLFSETAQGARVPTFSTRHVTAMMVADIDGLGEPSEDKNHNGLLDPGEDANGNAQIDWVDLPTETEDLNGNDKLDAGEDGQIGSANGKLDTNDYNNDGILTARREGVWDNSLDVVVSFDNDVPALLINNPTNQRPGYFTDEASQRLTGASPSPNRGLDIGDINLDGYLDIVIAQYVGGTARPVTVWLNQPKTSNGRVKWGTFKNISYELPYPRGVNFTFDLELDPGPNDASYTNWARDAKLLDMDGDGDLDMFVACLAGKNQTNVTGAADMMYVNRLVGDGFSFKGYDAQKRNGNPTVMNVVPRGVKRGTAGIKITIIGENLKNETLLSFGSGVQIKSMRKLDSSSLEVTVDVNKDAPLGPRAILAQNPSGSPTATKSGLFSVYDKVLNEVPNRTWTLYE